MEMGASLAIEECRKQFWEAVGCEGYDGSWEECIEEARKLFAQVRDIQRVVER